ncbi:AAA+-type ATPase [Saitoella coloradoensis]
MPPPKGLSSGPAGLGASNATRLKKKRPTVPKQVGTTTHIPLEIPREPLPEKFIVRPAQTSSTNSRTVQRVGICPSVMKGLGVGVGDLVIVRQEGDDTGRAAVGTAWTGNAYSEPSLVYVPAVLRACGGLSVGDAVTVRKFTDDIFEASEVLLNETTPDIDNSADEAIHLYLTEALVDLKHVTSGMSIECIYRGVTRSFIVDSIVAAEPGDMSMNMSQADISINMSALDLDDEDLTPAGPQVFLITRATSVTVVSHESAEADLEPVGPARDVPDVTYASIGGLGKQIEVLKDMVHLPLLQPEIFTRFAMRPPRGVLLYGPPGTGKTMLLRAVANETKAHIIRISGPSITSKYLGESEQRLRDIFEEANQKQPSIIFIDEVDALAPKREGGESGEAEGRVVATLLTLMDGMEASGRVVVVAATNRPNAIDEALRRPGRFDKELEVGIPDANARLQILHLQISGMPHELQIDDIENLASRTHGYVGADLAALTRDAAMRAIKRGLSEGIGQDQMRIRRDDLESALTTVRASAMREIFLEPPKVRWSDIGGQEYVKQKLREAVEWPLTHPDTFKRLGVTAPKGVLLYGPPGCSKTLTAKALATEAGLNFMAVKGPEIFNKYVGESERAIREVFRKARAASPSIIFFDEIDAIASSRGGSEGPSDRVLAALLNELDGIEALVNVTILAATNRPDVIDAALMRPGRLDRIIYVAPPDLDARKQILQIQISKMSVAADISIEELADATDGCSGAEIAALCQRAGLKAMEDNIDAERVEKRHFDGAVRSLVKRITPEVLKPYEDFRNGITTGASLEV